MDVVGGDAGADAGVSAGEWRPLLPVVVVLLALFAGWTVRVMAEVGEQRSALEAGVGRIQALSALQREAARWLAEEAPEVPDGWQRSTAAAQAVLDELGGTSPELAAGAAELRQALAAVEREPSPRSLGALQAAISGLLATLRAGNAGIAAALGERWDDLMRIALAALGLATLNAALLAYAQRRRRQALALAREVTRAADELAEARAALREREALARVADELRASRDLAEAAAEAKRRFTATMSHELLTPLNIVLGYADLLHERFEERDDAENLVDLDRLGAAARALLRLLRQVLLLTEIDDPDLRIDREPLPLAPLLSRLLGELRPLAERQGNRIELHVPGELRVASDPQRLATVLGEVIDNACRFTAGGVVEIRAWAEADGVRVDVRDEGPGMSDADRARAFDPYFQADTSSTRAHDGAGLGLTVAGRICVRLGGTIELQSLRGEGTTVSIWLPAA